MQNLWKQFSLIVFHLDKGLDQRTGKISIYNLSIRFPNASRRVNLIPGPGGRNQGQTKLIVPVLNQNKPVDHFDVTTFKFKFDQSDFFHPENCPIQLPLLIEVQMIVYLKEKGNGLYKFAIDTKYITLKSGGFTQELKNRGGRVRLMSGRRDHSEEDVEMHYYED